MGCRQQCLRRCCRARRQIAYCSSHQPGPISATSSSEGLPENPVTGGANTRPFMKFSPAGSPLTSASCERTDRRALALVQKPRGSPEISP
jgi:hypothetical protein